MSALEARITRLCQRWEDDCRQALLHIHGESHGLALAARFADSFPTAYQEDFSGRRAADDVQVLASLSPLQSMAVRLYRPLDSAPGMVRFKIFSLSKVALSDSLPVLERMGARVLDEHPYRLAGREAPRRRRPILDSRPGSATAARGRVCRDTRAL